VALASGIHRLGPENASLQVKTYREGMAAKVGHDLVIEVTRWDATVDLTASTVELNADPRSLEVRDGVRGLKPLTDKDRSEIRKNIDDKVLHGQPIEFRSTAVRLPEADGPLVVDGQLSMAGKTRPVTAQLDVDADGRVGGTIPLTQSEWGIKPYRGLMGALKVRDGLEIVLDARLQAG
jgi:polyisoprenoid-binding protein YceI